MFQFWILYFSQCNPNSLQVWEQELGSKLKKFFFNSAFGILIFSSENTLLQLTGPHDLIQERLERTSCFWMVMSFLEACESSVPWLGSQSQKNKY